KKDGCHLVLVQVLEGQLRLPLPLPHRSFLPLCPRMHNSLQKLEMHLLPIMKQLIEGQLSPDVDYSCP
ncbi:MAG: hypothetical protein EBT27_11895, partial [Betaproteobacteria bacterium]|nr:hypothetical protein [Betaproteobacteria bacterium]